MTREANHLKKISYYRRYRHPPRDYGGTAHFYFHFSSYFTFLHPDKFENRIEGKKALYAKKIPAGYGEK